MSLLEQILASKRAELPALRQMKLPTPPSELPAFVGRRRGGPLRLLCEIKKKSPSAGELSRALSVSQRARVYEECGASAISVLCDGPFFDGAYDDLLRAREGTNLPLLCKEFILDECQLDAARAFGASAVLLIVRCLAPARLSALIEATEERGLTAFVEVYTEAEAQVALDAGARTIGVNARDLDTLVMDTGGAARVLSALPDSIVSAHLSGVKSEEDVRAVRQGPSDAALVGEVLMRKDDPSVLLRSLVSAARD
jgi:indole-3-glycerol phosphate synthase